MVKKMRQIGLLFLVAVCFLLVGSSWVVAEVLEMVTDRPDATESSETILPGYVQIESGMTFFDEDEGGVESSGFAAPETLVRIGLDQNSELRLEFAGYQQLRERSAGGSTSKTNGYGDGGIGFKMKLGKNEQLGDVAFLAMTTLPWGQSEVTSGRVEPSYRFTFAQDINEDLSFGCNLGQAWVSEEDRSGDKDTRSVFQYTLSLGISMTDRLGSFVEFFGDVPTGSGSSGPANSFNGGFTYLLKENVQLDLVSGVGLSGSAEDWFIGAGISIRLPN